MLDDGVRSPLMAECRLESGNSDLTMSDRSELPAQYTWLKPLLPREEGTLRWMDAIAPSVP